MPVPQHQLSQDDISLGMIFTSTWHLRQDKIFCQDDIYVKRYLCQNQRDSFENLKFVLMVMQVLVHRFWRQNSIKSRWHSCQDDIYVKVKFFFEMVVKSKWHLRQNGIKWGDNYIKMAFN